MKVQLSEKQRFRDEFCNIVEMNKSKMANVPKGYKISESFQSEEEFNKVIHCENWAITQTKDSNVVFVDLDHNNPDQKLNKFFNRRRDKYVNHSERINSKHGFLKVTDADHEWCVEFAKKYNLKSGIEIYAEKHWVIFAGTYYNDKNIDDPMRETTWYPLDDLHKEPIIEVTKKDLGNVFDVIKLDESISAPSNVSVNEIIKDNFIIQEGQDRGNFILKYMTSRIIKNPEFLDSKKILLDIGKKYNEQHCDPQISDERLKALIKQSISYAVGVLKTRQIDGIVKSIPFDLEDEHNVIINHALKSVNALTKNKEKVNKDNLLPLILKSINEPNMKEYQEGGTKYEQLLEIINLVSDHAQSKLEFLQSYLESKPSNRFAHINEVDTKDQFNCWYWNKVMWSDNSAHHVLERLLLLKGEEIQPNSAMASSICDNLSASDKTLKVSLGSSEYVQKMMSVVTNSHGQYFDFEDGKIKQVDPSAMFFKEPQLDIFFKDDIEKPENFLKFVKERFPDKIDAKIFIDHLAGSLLHTSVLKSKPKMLFIRGEHDSYKSLIIEIMKKVIAQHSISKVSVQQLADKWGLSMIAEKMFNYSEEENAVEPKDPANLKESITIESGYVHVKFGKKLVFVSRFPRHTVMCNKIAPIARDDDDESIFIRNQYLEITKVEPLMDWRIELLDDNEIQKIGMFLLKRASAIYNGSKINVQGLEDSKKKHRELTLGTIEDFLDKHCLTKGVTSEIGTLFSWILSKYNDEMPSKISRELLEKQLEDIGHEKKTKVYVFRYIGEPNVFSESVGVGTDENKTQQTIVMGLKPSKIEKSATSRKDAKSEQSDGMATSHNT
jgi:hypothetical protein